MKLNRIALFSLIAATLAAAVVILATPDGRWIAGRVIAIARSIAPAREVTPPEYIAFADESTSGSLTRAAIALPLANPRIVIHKGRREAVLFDEEKEIKRYRIALGGTPEGAKERKGDSKTPEGRYYICTRLNQSQYHLFLGINYPNSTDAARGLNAGLISGSQHQTLVQDEQRGRKPSWETAMGGAIGLHGGGVRRDWTLGCIAFDNQAIEEIWAATRMGTPVEILP